MASRDPTHDTHDTHALRVVVLIIARRAMATNQEFLMFLTPLINADRIKRTIYRLFKFRNKLSPSLGNAGYTSTHWNS